MIRRFGADGPALVQSDTTSPAYFTDRANHTGQQQPSSIDGGTTGRVLRDTGAEGAWSTLVIPDTADAGSILFATAPDQIGGLEIGPANSVLASFGASPDWTDSPSLAGTLSVAGALTAGSTASTHTLRGETRHEGAASTASVLGAMVAGDSVLRGALRADGSLEWGTGAASRDARLRRSAAGALTIDSPSGGACNLNVNGALRITAIASTGGEGAIVIQAAAGMLLRGATGTTADLTLSNRSGVVALEVEPNARNVLLRGNLSLAGAAGSSSYGGGTGVLHAATATTAPTAAPASGFLLYRDPADGFVKLWKSGEAAPFNLG